MQSIVIPSGAGRFCGLEVKTPTPGDPGFHSMTRDFKIGSSPTFLPDARPDGVSAGTSRPGVSMIYRLVGLVVKASSSRAEDPGFVSRLRRDFFRGPVIPVTSKLALQRLPCQASGVIGSALGLVGPVSVYCGKFDLPLLSQCGSTSEQIRP